MIMIPKSVSLLLALVIVCLISFNHGSEAGEKVRKAEEDLQNGKNHDQNPKFRHGVAQLPSFEQFKADFKKSYRSISEELVRLKLFLGRSLRAFITRFKYKHGRSSYFTSINARSDFTLAELESSRNKHLADFGDLELKTLVRSTKRGWSLRAGFEEFALGDPTERQSADGHSNYKPVLVRVLNEGRKRSYAHLPVKSNFRMWGEPGPDSDAEIVERLWRDRWFGKPDAVWVDHRQTGCMSPVQDQEACGSCYAFATLAFLEWAHCRETGRKLALSEQYLVDCGWRGSNLFGCEGGAVAYASEFVLNFGLELAADYPYAARQDTCPYFERAAGETPQPRPLSLERMGRMRLNLTHISLIPAELLEEYLKFAPIIVSLVDFDDFHEFGGGVYDGRQCKSSGDDGHGAAAPPDTEPAHSLLLIGHGREDGEEYWLLRNSFGTSWGELGHIKLNKYSPCLAPPVGFILGTRDGSSVCLAPYWNDQWSKNNLERGRRRAGRGEGEQAARAS